ncbi:MAG: flagellar motor switch protein FliG [Candidatus Brocadiae bacterium]|nr:flagellar motor switch protein FliG [Candidatus Brocadiia bacterium]
MSAAKTTVGSTGLRKSAILLVSIEPDLAAGILSEMDRELIRDVSVEIARLEGVTREERDTVLEDFLRNTMQLDVTAQGGLPAARDLLNRVLEPAEAGKVLEALEAATRSLPFGFLRKADPGNLTTFLQDEHPQTVALVLSYLPPPQAAEILQGLPHSRQVDIVRRISTMEVTSPEVLQQVEGALEKRLSSLFAEDLRRAGGVKAVASILNLTDRPTERGILDALEEQDPQMVDSIRKLMFVFEDIKRVDDHGVQIILKDVETMQLALALKVADEELKAKFFRNMSKRAQELLREEMEYMGPQRLSDVEAAQQSIVEVVRKYEDLGDIVIEGRGSSRIVV